MCGGASHQMQQSQQLQNSFDQTLLGNYSQLYGEQQQTLNNLNASLNPIVGQGPNQTGFSPAELAAMNTQILDTTGANYAAATRAANTQLSGKGAGGAGTPGTVTPGQSQIDAAIASQAAGQQSSEQNQLTQANYAVGRQNWQNALSGEEGVAQLESPNAEIGGFDTGNSNDFNMANTINEENQQGLADLVGGIAGLGMDAATFGAGAMGGGGFAGGMKALAGEM